MEFITPTKATSKFLSNIDASILIFINVDAVVGKLVTPMIKAEFGQINIVHQLRDGREDWSDADFVRGAYGVLSTCWDHERTIEACWEACIDNPNLSIDKIRLYDLGTRIELAMPGVSHV